MLIKEKVEQSSRLLKEFGIDCWLTFVRETSLNGDPVLPFLVDADLTWHSAVLIAADGRKKAIVGLYDQKGVEDLGVYDTVVGYVEGIKKPLLESLQELNPKTIAVNYSQESEICDGLTHGMYLQLVEFLKEIGFENRLVSSERVISALRQRKTAAEVDHMRAAIKATLEIFDSVAGFIKPGKTEEQIAEYMRGEVKKRGLTVAWDPKVCPSVFTGPDTAGAHYNPTARVVQEGHILNMDFGVKVNGYCSDLQRTFYIMKKGETSVPADVQKGFDTIVDSIDKSFRALKPGVTGNEIDTISRKVITTNGYAEYPHALGHQVGRFAHDGTALLAPAWEKYGRKPFIPVEQGMVFTLEPRLTVPDRGVATIEEMVVVTADGAEYLSKPQKDIIVIKP